MMDERAALEDACKACLQRCFDTLVIDLALGQDTDAVGFRRCRDRCRQALTLAVQPEEEIRT